MRTEISFKLFFNLPPSATVVLHRFLFPASLTNYHVADRHAEQQEEEELVWV